MSLFAVYFSSAARVEGLRTIHLEDRAINEVLFHSAYDWARHEILKFRKNQALLKRKDELEAQFDQTILLYYPRYEPYAISMGNQTVSVQLLDLSGKLNVNQLTEPRLKRVVQACGLPEGLEQTRIVNSILDWRDTDSLHRAEGAEKEYYESLPTPYVPKNNPIETIEELLLIRGVSGDVFHGTSEHPGLKDFLTVHGQQEKMDINNAAPGCFAVVESMSHEVVTAIIEFRRGQRIWELSDLTEVIPYELFSQAQEYFTVSSSETLRITAGTAQNGTVQGHPFVKDLYLGGS